MKNYGYWATIKNILKYALFKKILVKVQFTEGNSELAISSLKIIAYELPTT